MDINKSADQLLVRVGRACNFKCNFCNVSDNETHVRLKENINDIVRNFHYKLKYSDLSSKEITITISGGEPSIFQKETIFALKYIGSVMKKLGVTPLFEIQTNGSNIDKDFAKKLRENGIYSALVSFHMVDKDIFEKVIQIPYSNFRKIEEGINNLHEAGIEVYTNTIMSNENKSDFFQTLLYIEKTFPFINIFNIGMIQPHGEAEKVLDMVYPRYEEVIDSYNRSLFYLRQKGKQVVSHFVGPPACYIGHMQESLEVSENSLFRKGFNLSDQYLINNINDTNKVQIDECNSCLYNNVCSGIWKEYIGLQKLKPVNYVKDYSGDFTKNTTSYKLRFISESLKQLYDKNIRQVIVSSSLGDKNEIYKVLQEATKIGFYKVTLLINNDFTLEADVFRTGVSNIQTQLKHISISFISDLIEFSGKFQPQFRIDLDIFIYQEDLHFTSLFKESLKLLPSNYMNFYFLYSFKNKEMKDKYTNILASLKQYGKNIHIIPTRKKMYE